MNRREENKLARYHQAIDNLPSVRGTGSYNAGICSVTMHGIHLGLSVNEIKQDLKIRNRGCYQPNEVENAYRSSLKNGASAWDFESSVNNRTVFSGTPLNTQEPVIERKVRIINREEYTMELIESSPYRLLDDPDRDLELILEYGFKSDEFVFIGDKFDTAVYPVSYTLENITSMRNKPFTCINPYTGQQEETNAGKMSYRAEKAVSHVRYMLIEMDDTSMPQQVGFWMEQIKKLPVFTIIDSGSKSLHGWVKVDCTPDEWDRKRNEVFNIFKPYGIDKACKNKSRLSRTASHNRKGGRKQSVLYLNIKHGA